MIVRWLQQWKLPLTWVLALQAIFILGIFRTHTNTEYALATAVIIPVVWVAWVGGFKHGLWISGIAAMMFLSSDLLSFGLNSSSWIFIVNAVLRLATYLFVAYLVARVRTLLDREIENATHDALTGLLNRGAFMKRGSEEAVRAHRYGHPMAVIFMDLDNFKQLNDTRGHETGDAALQAVADGLNNALRATDSIARLGGDEFAILLPEIDNQGAAETGDKIASSVTAALAPYPPVSVSVGVAWYECSHANFASMLRSADALMYELKKATKGGVQFKRFCTSEV